MLLKAALAQDRVPRVFDEESGLELDHVVLPDAALGERHRASW